MKKSEAAPVVAEHQLPRQQRDAEIERDIERWQPLLGRAAERHEQRRDEAEEGRGRAQYPIAGVVEITVSRREVARIAESDEGIVENREASKRHQPRDHQAAAERGGRGIDIEAAQPQPRVPRNARPRRIAHASTGR